MTRPLHETLPDELAALAGFVRANPELAEDMNYTFSKLYVPITLSSDQRGHFAAFARAGKAGDAKIRKHFDDDWCGVDLIFGEHVLLHIYAERDQVCERIITGIREVEQEIPDPDAPKIKVTRTEEIVEWRCQPLLADDEQEASPVLLPGEPEPKGDGADANSR